MINQLEDLFIKMWRAASILSVFFAVYYAFIFTRGMEGSDFRWLIIVGAFVSAGIFAGATAWAVRLLDQAVLANELAEKQLKMSMRINQQLLKMDAGKSTTASGL